MQKQKNELTLAEKELVRLIQLSQTYNKGSSNKHQTLAQRARSLTRLHNLESRIQEIQRKIYELQGIIEHKPRPSEELYEQTIRPFSSVFDTQETQYLIALAALEEQHERAIANATHFRVFAEEAQEKTIERAKRVELYEHWQRRADNIERRINQHVKTSTPEALRATELEECGVDPTPAEKTSQRPGNHVPGPRPKHPEGKEGLH